MRNRQCGICTTDLTIFFVDIDPRVAPAALPGINRVYLGHEAVGVVAEVGSEVERFTVGDRVVMEARPWGSPNCFTQELETPCEYCSRGDTRLCLNSSLRMGPEGAGGGLADSYTAHESEVWPVPDDISDDQASLI